MSQETVYKPTSETLKPQLLQTEKQIQSTSKFLYLTAVIANLLGFCGGAIISWSSPVITKLKDTTNPELNPLSEPITDFQASWIAGIIGLGGIFGPVVLGRFVDTTGRKRIIQCCCLIYIKAHIILAFAHYVFLFYVARFMNGAVMAIIFVILPLYIGEISEVHNRGTLGCFLAISIAGGILFSLAVGPLFTIQMFNFICCIPAILLLVLSYTTLPESPHYLISIGDYNATERTLIKLRGRKNVKLELESLINSSKENSDEKSGLCDLLKSYPGRKALLLCVTMMGFQQLSGINAVWAYLETIFEIANCGLSTYFSSILITVVQVFATLVTSAIVDKINRKVLLIISSFGCGLSMFGLGLFFHLKTLPNVDITNFSWLPVGSLVFYVIILNFGLGPLPWPIVSEMFTSQLRPIASTVISVLCFLMSFIVTLIFPLMSAIFGSAVTFWFFGLSCVIHCVFVYFFMPETKGKSINEIQDYLCNRKK